MKRVKRTISLVLSCMMVTLLCGTYIPVKAAQTSDATVTKTSSGYQMSNAYFNVQIGQYGNIESLKLTNDQYDTNYVMNKDNTSGLAAAAGHQWLGELMFKVKVANGSYFEENTGRSDSGRHISLDGKKVVITYYNSREENGIKNFKLTETYELIGNQLQWGMKVETPRIRISHLVTLAYHCLLMSIGLLEMKSTKQEPLITAL